MESLRYIRIGHCNADMSVAITVACSTDCPTCESTSLVRILSVLPVSPSISGSHSTLKTSPTTGSSTLKGNRTSSFAEVINLYHVSESTTLNEGADPPRYSEDAIDPLIVM